MIYVLKLSNDMDIRSTELHSTWGKIEASYTARIVTRGELNIPNDAVIVVIAHGNDTEIGDSTGRLAFSPEELLNIIWKNMAADAAPGSVYISTCATGLALFAAGVRNAADARGIWQGVSIFGHETKVRGKVPPPRDRAWTGVY